MIVMKLTLKQIRKTVFSLILVVLGFGAGFFWGTHKVNLTQEKFSLKSFKIVNKTTPIDKDLNFDLFWDVWNRLEEKYLIKEDIDRQKMFYGAIQGMTAALGDPYTAFLPPVQNKKLKEDLNGAFEGVGIRLGFNKDKRLTVIAPLKGMPAEKAGVKAGDIIIHLKDEVKELDEDTLGMSLPEAVEKIRGESGAEIVLTLIHENESQSYEAKIKRETIIVPSVTVEFLENNTIAHLKLTRFGELTSEQWDKSVDEILNKEDTIKGIILDVRGNPGGYLKGSVNLASEFLEKGVIVKQEDYRGEVETYSVNRKGRILTLPLIVLIDKGSASASEILAGALKDHGRAKLIGTQTFGKGTIQESEEINGGMALHITTAKWLTPNNKWVNEESLIPDIEVENNSDNPDEDLQLNKAIEELN
ncbi:peptidase S41 [Candidatus Beckwithbacteria bacterium CG10_big_fil_rev_8_21_14_0_10_34_10]|uniref:Peptidase S41 n=1 Tax=Candidatus Beckwithbacteria bacterium CG10_big_fil_rev_8_21_14_0_10_34_10 TaxID=1974495 RepID=A0A2H0W8U0_9BACT|nr:MAG: peptidase S41 [Candidatus Beckwithbacteria bacterium CG10_big_fil_rev_8_21_14_0_10_34_10]